MMTTRVTGGCRCGAIRYECSAEPLGFIVCHCHDCQQATGSAFAAVLMVPRNAVTITGEARYFDVMGDSGSIVGRGFCPTCGSPLFVKPQFLPDILSIRVGSLDDGSWYRPEIELYARSAQQWVRMEPPVPKFTQMPTTEQWQDVLAARQH